MSDFRFKIGFVATNPTPAMNQKNQWTNLTIIDSKYIQGCQVGFHTYGQRIPKVSGYDDLTCGFARHGIGGLGFGMAAAEKQKGQYR